MHGLAGGFDLPHLQTIHRIVFQDIYSWAGEVRTIPIAKNHPFCLPQFIEEQATQLFASLASEQGLVNLKCEVFIDRLTHFMSELNAIHPFREGNGRSQRMFFELLASDAGYVLDWSQTTEAENIAAHIAAMEGDTRLLRAMISAVVI